MKSQLGSAGQVAFPLIVRYPAEVQQDLESMRRTRIDTPSAVMVPLAPMAVVMLFGLLSATALNMLVVPIVYLRFSRMRQRYDA